ncbi:MAG: restriction endonuclease subunit M [Candidatus Parabeggiatoa sp. nov. 3]|nr:MAG: restriction endonuclease subunit M [Gammaproteobacteria bacterium]
MSISPQIQSLVERFASQQETYQQSTYNETQTRREFIDPFFIALGWDVANEQGYAEAYKDVIHEDALKIGRATKAPDYSFRIGGLRKFFLEAKKPSIQLKNNAEAAFQVRRYGWSAKLPLSILTNFSEFAVYDCRIKPVKNDNAAHARILYLTYTEYLARWEELIGIFSREAILKGAFDKYIDSKTHKKGTAEVDTAFLTEIERWRDMLARNIALRNSVLSSRQLNFAVQQTIDRIIFLRICEDRGIEDYGRLLALQNGPKIYTRLFQHFSEADERYNSGLFHFKAEKGRDDPDTLTPSLIIDDKILKDILKNLYYPDSPYEFSVLPADILGQVYEQFLGQVIRLTPAHRAVIEQKPDIKKAGGVYYTPTYIVDYIVKQTVGPLVHNQKLNQISHLKILDPACGSGSFLLGAYQFLLDWHSEHYQKNPSKWASGKNPRLYQISGGTWQLTLPERKRILLNNLYGVDIDPQAVEVTKLSLLLKVLENEQNLFSQLSLWKERVLPDLDNNIKCGNSLISTDFYQGQQLGLLDEETLYRINAFDWESEFAPILKTGGFDAVIGNPPYGALLSSLEIDYLREKQTTAQYQIDTYPLFIEKAYYLSKQNGYFGMIVPSAWVASQYNEALRQFIVSKTILKNVVIAPKNTFVSATVETLILISKKTEPKETQFLVERWDKKEKISYFLDQKEIEKQPAYRFSVYCEPKITKLLDKIDSLSMPLSEYASVVWGVKIYQKGKGKPKQKGEESQRKIFHSSTKTKQTHKPLIGGREINRYVIDWKGMYVDYGEWLAEPRTPDWFTGWRILVREVTDKGIIQASMMESDFVFSNSVDGIRLKKKESEKGYELAFILGIINSKFISFYHLNTSANAFKGTFPKLLVKDLLTFPIRTIDFDNPTDKANHDKLVQFVEQMIAFNKQLAAENEPQTKTLLKRRIDAIDRQIDELVYRLYGLTVEEIEIVEKNK